MGIKDFFKGRKDGDENADDDADDGLDVDLYIQKIVAIFDAEQDEDFIHGVLSVLLTKVWQSPEETTEIDFSEHLTTIMAQCGDVDDKASARELRAILENFVEAAVDAEGDDDGGGSSSRVDAPNVVTFKRKT
jgi:hypothetical protein